MKTLIVLILASLAFSQQPKPSDSVKPQPQTVVTLTLSPELATALEKERVDNCNRLVDVSTKKVTCEPAYADIATLVKAKLRREIRQTLLTHPPSTVAAHKVEAEKAAKAMQEAIAAAATIQ